MDRDEFYKIALASGWLSIPKGASSLSSDDRKIALSAIAGRASGSPASAAAEILAGVAVLDGDHYPILLWANDVTREEKAAWHRAEAAFWEDSAQRFAALTDSLRSAPRTQSESLDPRSTNALVQPLPESASFQSDHREAGIENPLPGQCRAADQGASDAS